MELPPTFPKVLNGQRKRSKHMHYLMLNHVDAWSPGQTGCQTQLNKGLWIYDNIYLNCRLIKGKSDYRRYEHANARLWKRPDFFFRLYFYFCLSSVHTCQELSRLQNKTGWRNGKMLANQIFSYGPGLNKRFKPIYRRVVNKHFVSLLAYR